MADESVTLDLTKQVEFWNMPADGKHLMMVNSGLTPALTEGFAECLEVGVREILADAVADGLSGNVAYLLEFVLDATQALRRASA